MEEPVLHEDIPVDTTGRVLWFISRVGIPGAVVAVLLYELHLFLQLIAERLTVVISNQGQIISLLNNFCGKK